MHDDQHPFSEAIGVVMTVSADADGTQMLTILSRRGVTIEVSSSDLIAAKLFPN